MPDINSRLYSRSSCSSCHNMRCLCCTLKSPAKATKANTVMKQSNRSISCVAVIQLMHASNTNCQLSACQVCGKARSQHMHAHMI
jgi:hypothetical protein